MERKLSSKKPTCAKSKYENGDDIGIANLIKEFDDVFQDKKILPVNAERRIIKQTESLLIVTGD